MSTYDRFHNQLREALNVGDVELFLNLISDDEIDVDYRDITHDLQTLLMRLCYVKLETTSLFAILEAIMDKNPDVNIQDSWGRSVLMHACIASIPMIIETLLEHENTDVSLIDFEGNSALSYAVQNCDIYTMDDILQHAGGPHLLTIQNKQGHTPYNIVKKSGNKQVLRLFDSYVNETVVTPEEKKRKRRKPRNRDVIKQLPPAYSPSPERNRLSLSSHNTPNVSPRKSTSSNVQYTNSKSEPPTYRAVETEDNYSTRSTNNPNPNSIDTNTLLSQASSAITEKCDSAPVARPDRENRTGLISASSLPLSSPKLARRHHKQDSLLTETLLLNQSKKLPYFKNKSDMYQSGSGEVDFDFGMEMPSSRGLRRQRRPSISLPDLRNVTGCLVNSGDTSPATDYAEGADGNSREHSPEVSDHSDDDNDYGTDDNEVFTQSYPTALLARKLQTSLPYRRQVSDNQISLPDINKGSVTLTTPRNKRRGLSSLINQRKYSTSDDQIHWNKT